jgi:predicted aspartyl protease
MLVVLGGRAGAADGEIALMRDGAVYRVPVTLNGGIVRLFLIDTGASEVQVSTDVLRALFPEARPLRCTSPVAHTGSPTAAKSTIGDS